MALWQSAGQLQTHQHLTWIWKDSGLWFVPDEHSQVVLCALASDQGYCRARSASPEDLHQLRSLSHLYCCAALPVNSAYVKHQVKLPGTRGI